jgi:hypothetical protein
MFYMAYNETPMKGNAMLFKNRELRIKVANTKNDNEKTTTKVDEILHTDTLQKIEETGKRLVKYVAGAVVAGIVIVKAADTLSQIAVKKTKSADDE